MALTIIVHIVAITLLILARSEPLKAESIVDSVSSQTDNALTEKSTASPDVCLTESCAQESLKVLSKLNLTIDP